MFKVAFLQEQYTPYPGIMTLAAVIKQEGYGCDVFIKSTRDDFIKQIIEYRPDLIGISFMTGSQTWVLQTIKKIKDIKNIPVIVGGAHPTSCPEFINEEGVDILCVGEGEGAILELCQKMSNKEEFVNIKNLWVKVGKEIYKNNMRNLISNLDEVPMIDYKIYEKYPILKNSKRLLYDCSRGCIYRCSFCYVDNMVEMYNEKGRYFRTKSVSRVIEELSLLVKENRPKIVNFGDAIFGVNRKWLEDFTVEYKNQIGIPFVAQVEASSLGSKSVELLAQAGCYALTFGVETGNDDIRKRILNKRAQNKDLLNAARLIKCAGIKLRTSNMLCIPGETLEDAWETVTLNSKMKVDYPWAYLLQPYPGTKIFQFAKDNSFVDDGFTYDQIRPLNLFDSKINISDRKKIQNLQRLFFYAVRFPFMLPFIKLLININGGFVFSLLQKLSLGYMYIRFHRISFLEFIIFSLRMWDSERK